MSEPEDLNIIVQAFDEARRLLRSHVELSADPATIIQRMTDLLAGPQIVQALERARLRSLREGLIDPGRDKAHP